MPFTENFAEFLRVDEFASAGTWSVGPTPINLIFDSGFEAAQLGLIAGIEGVRLVALVETASVPTIAHGQTIAIGSLIYTIRGIRPDGTGMTTLVLEESDEETTVPTYSTYVTHCEAYGALPTALATVNGSAIQQALDQGGTVTITSPGIYLVGGGDDTSVLKIDSDTRFYVGPGVTLVNSSTAGGVGTIFITNRNAKSNRLTNLTTPAITGVTATQPDAGNKPDYWIITVSFDTGSHGLEVGDYLYWKGGTSQQTFTNADIDTSADEVACSHGTTVTAKWFDGQAVRLKYLDVTTAATLSSGTFADGNLYYVKVTGATASKVKLYTDAALTTQVNFTAAGTGIYQIVDINDEMLGVHRVSGVTTTTVVFEMWCFTTPSVAYKGLTLYKGDSNITLEGQGVIDCNFKGQTGVPSGNGVLFNKVGNLKTAIAIKNCLMDALYVQNCYDSDFDFSFSESTNQKIQFMGPGGRISYRGARGTTGDDNLGLITDNTGYTAMDFLDTDGTASNYGPLRGVQVLGSQMRGGLAKFLIFAGPASEVSDVSIDTVIGTSDLGAGINFANPVSGKHAVFRSITVKNVVGQWNKSGNVIFFYPADANYGYYHLDGVSLSNIHPRVNNGAGFTISPITISGGAKSIRGISVTGFSFVADCANAGSTVYGVQCLTDATSIYLGMENAYMRSVGGTVGSSLLLATSNAASANINVNLSNCQVESDANEKGRVCWVSSTDANAQANILMNACNLDRGSDLITVAVNADVSIMGCRAKGALGLINDEAAGARTWRVQAVGNRADNAMLFTRINQSHNIVLNQSSNNLQGVVRDGGGGTPTWRIFGDICKLTGITYNFTASGNVTAENAFFFSAGPYGGQRVRVWADQGRSAIVAYGVQDSMFSGRELVIRALIQITGGTTTNYTPSIRFNSNANSNATTFTGDTAIVTPTAFAVNTTTKQCELVARVHWNAATQLLGGYYTMMVDNVLTGPVALTATATIADARSIMFTLTGFFSASHASNTAVLKSFDLDYVN